MTLLVHPFPLRNRLRPLTRSVLTLLTAAWLMLALQPCAMAMPAMEDCEQCPSPETGMMLQTECLASASCVARQDWQHTQPMGMTPLTPALPFTLAWYEAPPSLHRLLYPTPAYILPPPFQRFDRLHI